MMIPWIVIGVLLLPLAACWSLWLVFALLALFPPRRLKGVAADKPGFGDQQRITVDILIPAHNEHALLPLLLQSLQAQTEAGNAHRGTVLVVADHCSDETAKIARRHGVEVLERTSGPRGKPAALRDGLAVLLFRGSAAVAIIDADCTASPNLVEEVASAFAAGYKVAQTANLVFDPNSPNSLSTIAFSLKNLIRPRGMARVGIGTQLFGTGMCFHTSLLAEGGPIRFSDHLTEDLAVSHDLLLRRMPPIFLPAAMVRSPIPTDNASMSTQKLRWETGQVHTWKNLPRLLVRLLCAGQFRSTLALLDWSAPPVAMAVLAWTAITALAAVFVVLGIAAGPLLLAPAAVLSLLIFYIVVGTLQLAGPAALGRMIIVVPRFFFWKLTLYLRMATGRGAKGWQKSREEAAPVPPAPQEVHP